jgi:prepilin-type N-terminal cleavage/methylation domain-containing protein
MKGLKNKKGFTLIELLMVIGIIGILVSIVIVNEMVTKLILV